MRSEHGESIQRQGDRILVVDDDEVNRELLRTRLKRSGFRVEEAASGEQALEMARPGAFELLLLDIMIP